MNSLVRLGCHRSSVGLCAVHRCYSTSSHDNLEHYTAVNEPILLYKRGSAERKALEKELTSFTPVSVPIVIGDEEIRTGDRRCDQVAPFDHKRKLASYHWANKSQIGRAIDVSVAARKDWERRSWQDRARIMLKAADLMSGPSYRYKLLASTMLGQSKTIYQAEIDAAAELIDFLRFNVQHLTRLLEYSPLDTSEATNTMCFRGNEGFWAAISPFNFTAIGGHLAAAPAFMGNVVLWKPTDTAVLSNYYVFQALREAGVPAGVINFVPADGPVFGDVVTRSRHLAGINFTGSVPTFRTICKLVGQNMDRYRSFPRLIGECGGKNYHLVHSSADVEVVSVCSVRSAFEYSGQKCSACSRLYVPESLWPQIKQRLCELMDKLKLGSPLERETFTSAVIDQNAYNRIKAHIERAKSNSNLKVIAGGYCDDSEGYYIEPTLVVCSDPKDLIMKEEIFGPVLSVFVYKDNKVDDVMELIDETTDYALTGSIFSREESFLHSAASKLRDSCGNMYFNNPSTGSVVNQQPFGGARLSGTNDKAGGPHYLLRFSSAQALKHQHAPITDWRQAHMN